MDKDPIVIVAAKRTPIGDFQGDLAPESAPTLGSHAIKGALESAGVAPDAVDQVIMGCVLQAGIGQAPARQASIFSGLPESVPALTINKMCGSGLESVILATQALLSGQATTVVAGGQESMSQAPYLLPKARDGFRMGHQKVYDHMFLDGLEDAYEQNTLMGVFAERTAEKYHLTRESQDEFALTSLRRAQEAMSARRFDDEIVPVSVALKKETVMVSQDSLPQKARPEKIPTLKPAFDPRGTVTAANSSAISDGAAALIVTRASVAQSQQWPILAEIKGVSRFAQAPAWFTTAPVGAIQRVLENTHWSVKDVERFEINEAFAVVTLAAIHDLGLSPDIVNVHGGACALGHPIGASGARILTTLLHGMRQNNEQKGIASLCIGGGEAVAVAIERTESCQ